MGAGEWGLQLLILIYDLLFYIISIHLHKMPLLSERKIYIYKTAKRGHFVFALGNFLF